MEFRYIKGQRLVIQLINHDVFEGDCVKCGKDRIDLINIVEHQHGNTLKDTLSYYRSEIESVTVLDEENKSPPEEPQLNNEVQSSPSRKVIAMSQDEYDRLKSMTIKYIYLTEIDEEYSKAVSYLENCESVSIFATSCNVEEQKRISLLAVSSRVQVYLFDLLLLSGEDFPAELKPILQSHEIVKVVHDAQPISECLWQLYQVKLNNVFDTHDTDLKLQAAEIKCEAARSRNLLECLEHFFNFPKTIVEETTNINWKKWEKRPLKDSRKIQAAQFVAYLITLKNKQKQILLKDHNDIVTTRIEMLKNSETFDAQKSLNSGDVIVEELLIKITNVPPIGYYSSE